MFMVLNEYRYYRYLQIYPFLEDDATSKDRENSPHVVVSQRKMNGRWGEFLFSFCEVTALTPKQVNAWLDAVNYIAKQAFRWQE